MAKSQQLFSNQTGSYPDFSGKYLVLLFVWGITTKFHFRVGITLTQTFLLTTNHSSVYNILNFAYVVSKR